MRAKKLIVLMPILCLLCALYNVAYAAPVYIDVLADFPAYPYNTGTYMQGGRYVGCGPTTGAMILGYFEHHFGAAGLLMNPVAGVDEGLDTAWELHSASYMKTNAGGGSAPADIKPGMEGYAEDRGYQIKVMAHFETTADPTDAGIIATYGAYGDGWTNDVDFWVDLGGGVWDIDPDKFCDFVSPKLSAGICIWLSVDAGTGGADHWVPCVGVDKDTDEYYLYDTYDTPLRSEDIIAVGAPGAGLWAIGFIRSVTYIGPLEQDPVAAFVWSPEPGTAGAPVSFDASGSTDPDGTIVSYEWDFGDGTTDTGVNPDHTYALDGTYTVTLVVTDNDGRTDTVVHDVHIGPVGPVVPTIESCDSTGTKKDTFQLSDEVYATGTGYQPSTSYDIFLVEDVTWVDGMAIPPRVPGTTAAITSDGAGNVPATLMWSDPLVPGKYDIVVDVDGDGSYYAEADALDDNDIEVTAGLLIIPEVALGTIMALAAMVLALVIYAVVPKWKRK